MFKTNQVLSNTISEVQQRNKELGLKLKEVKIY